MRLFVPFLFASIMWAQTPTGLTVKSATSSQVQLAWSGGAGTYTVQRAPVGAAFTSIATVTTTSYTDTQIDAYLQFTYQIVAGTSVIATSNPVTVGPPPAGLSLVAASPLTGGQVNLTYGENVSLAFDGNGDPAFAFLFGDPDSDGNNAEGQLWFQSWNRAQTQWNPLVLLATPGNVAGGNESVIALAYDASTSAFALATEDVGGNIDLYISTSGGVTWSLKNSFTGPGGMGGLDGPAMALGAGNIYLTYQSGAGLQYVTGKLSASPSGWTTVGAPFIGNTIGPSPSGVSSAVAIDSSGNPAIAFWAPDQTTDGGQILFFWRPSGSAAPVMAANTGGIQSSELGVRMVFYQGNPRIVFAGATSVANGANGQNINFVRSDDGGNTWQPVVAIPTDVGSSDDYPVDVAVDSNDNGALAFDQNTSNGQAVCGNPKLALSSDLVNWTICQVAPNLGDFSGAPGAIQIRFGGNNKRYVFWQSNGNNSSNSGVVMYRDPPNNQPTGPLISNVLDAEGGRATIVPGEWVAIYGANLAGTTRSWAQADFVSAGNLPTNLSGVGVQFNGLPAAVYYISPVQLDVQAPAGISGTVPVTVTNNGAISGLFNTTVVQNAPSLFYYPAGSNLYAAATHLDGTLIGDPAVTSSATKAAANETIVLYVNGVAPSPGGVIIGGAIAYSGPVTVNFGTAAATPGFTGLVAAGEYQINVAVPSTLKTGNYPLTVTVQGQVSPLTILLPVQ